MASVTEWIARLVDGTLKRRSDAGLVKYIEPGSLESITVETDHPKFGMVHVSLDPSRGHHAHVFTRVFNSQGMGHLGSGQSRVPVIEVITDPSEPVRSAVRICLMRDGILVTTKPEEP